MASVHIFLQALDQPIDLLHTCSLTAHMLTVSAHYLASGRETTANRQVARCDYNSKADSGYTSDG